MKFHNNYSIYYFYFEKCWKEKYFKDFNTLDRYQMSWILKERIENYVIKK